MKNYYGYGLNKKDKRFKKWKKQRKKIGFDDTELWNLNTTIAKFILPRLKRYNEVSHCFPKNEEIQTSEDWKNSVNKMINSFELIIKLESDLLNKEEFLQCEEGLALFAKYLYGMWT